jgi:hypothetical protein
MRSKTLCLAAALILAPAALLAQDSTTAAGPAAGADARIDAALSTALDAGIPVSLLEGKIAEGKAKGVSMDRIAAAVQHRLDGLLKAQDALEKAGLESTTEGELSVAADAVQGGVSQSALAAISQRSTDGNRAVAIAVLTDLVAQGHVPEQALAQVESALARGPEALANLSAESAGAGRGQAAAGANVAGGAGGAAVQAGAGARVELGTPRGH